MTVVFLCGTPLFCLGQNVFGHALVPDMIADASIQEINGVFYCNATTDGMGNGLKTSGPPVVWKSSDFVNWSFNGRLFPADMTKKYWAPSKMVHYNGKWYLYPTLDGKIHVATADSPDGPFTLANPKPIIDAIDAEIFIDDDGKKYIFWNRRGVARLSDDMLSIDMSTKMTIPSPHNVYSEGPCFFKRNGIYYYVYTLGGDENYQYAYMMSRKSPFGPYDIPEHDIITTTNYNTGTFGPGHGCVFKREKTDDYYIAFLEFGRNSTNRQTYVNKLEFNEDGTIKPVEVSLDGVGALNKSHYGKPLNVVSVKASSVAPPASIRYFKDPKCQRTEHFDAEFAVDRANGSRWMAAETVSDKPQQPAWIIMDLGKLHKVHRSEVAFVRPTESHMYLLEMSENGSTWTVCGGNAENKICSPYIDHIGKRARYLRLTILGGVQGIWEWHAY